jgi:hypothetical protein
MQPTDVLLLVANLVASAAMTGLIWFVQVVHYPLFAAVAPVGDDGFRAYETSHRFRTGFVVMPFMGLELLAAVALVLATPDGLPRAAAGGLLVLLLVVLGTTFLVSVPAHEALNRGFDAAAHRRLCRTNWIRTAGWTARMVGSAAALVVVAT